MKSLHETDKGPVIPFETACQAQKVCPEGVEVFIRMGKITPPLQRYGRFYFRSKDYFCFVEELARIRREPAYFGPPKDRGLQLVDRGTVEVNDRNFHRYEVLA